VFGTYGGEGPMGKATPRARKRAKGAQRKKSSFFGVVVTGQGRSLGKREKRKKKGDSGFQRARPDRSPVITGKGGK